MSPITTEANLEEDISVLSENIADIRRQINLTQFELNRYKSFLVGIKLDLEQKEEELRQFRLMYPDICKPPTR